MNIDHVKARRAIAALLATTRIAGNFDKAMRAQDEAHAVYISLFTDEEKARIVSQAQAWGIEFHKPPISVETFSQAIEQFGTSLVSAALGDEA